MTNTSITDIQNTFKLNFENIDLSLFPFSDMASVHNEGKKIVQIVASTMYKTIKKVLLSTDYTHTGMSKQDINNTLTAFFMFLEHEPCNIKRVWFLNRTLGYESTFTLDGLKIFYDLPCSTIEEIVNAQKLLSYFEGIYNIYEFD